MPGWYGMKQGQTTRPDLDRTKDIGSRTLAGDPGADNILTLGRSAKESHGGTVPLSGLHPKGRGYCDVCCLGHWMPHMSAQSRAEAPYFSSSSFSLLKVGIFKNKTSIRPCIIYDWVAWFCFTQYYILHIIHHRTLNYPQNCHFKWLCNCPLYGHTTIYITIFIIGHLLFPNIYCCRKYTMGSSIKPPLPFAKSDQVLLFVD